MTTQSWEREKETQSYLVSGTWYKQGQKESLESFQDSIILPCISRVPGVLAPFAPWPGLPQRSEIRTLKFSF